MQATHQHSGFDENEYYAAQSSAQYYDPQDHRVYYVNEGNVSPAPTANQSQYPTVMQMKSFPVYSSVSTVSNTLDCGASISLTPDLALLQNKVATSSFIQTASTPLYNPTMGTLSLETSTTDGALHVISLPGSLGHPSCASNTLVSYAQLLEHGYQPHLYRRGGYVLTPEGKTIPLLFNKGIWSFPPPPSPSSWTLSRRHLSSRRQAVPLIPYQPPTSNVFSSLASPDPMSPAPDSEVHEPPSTPEMQAHRSAGHPHNRKLIRAYQKGHITPSEPLSLPALRNLSCPSCNIMSSSRPPSYTIQPRRGVKIWDFPATTRSPPPRSPHSPANRPLRTLRPAAQARPVSIGTRGYQPGECLHLDYLGTFTEPTLGNYTEGLVITDDYSGARFVLLQLDKRPESLLQSLQLFQAQSNVKIRCLLADPEFKTSALANWMAGAMVKFVGSPPSAHVARAEASVRYIKEKARVFRHTGGASPIFQGLAYVHAANCLNMLETESDPTGTLSSPLQLWPTMPFQHPSLQRAPLFCRMYLHEGKRTDRAYNINRRARPGIFVGYDQLSPSYLLYDLDSQSIIKAHIARFDETSFPLMDMLTAGEHMPRDLAFDIDGWRACAPHHPDSVSDDDLAEFCTGKQIHVHLPPDFYPSDSPHFWTAQCQRPIRKRDTEKSTHILMVTTAFSGPPSRLPPSYKDYKSTPITFELSITATSSQVDTSLRRALRHTYPHALTLAQIAQMNADMFGFPVHPAVLEPSLLPPQGEPVTTPAIEQGEPSSPPSPSPILRRSARRAGTARIAQVRKPSTVSFSSGKIGFEPSSRSAARRHSSWPLWAAAERTEVDNLIARGCFQACQLSDLPADAQVIGSMFTYKDKDSGPKARCVGRGDQEFPKPSPTDTYASTPIPSGIRAMLSIAAQRQQRVDHIDISQAFIQSDDLPSSMHIYMRPPPGYNTDPNVVWRVIKPIYGLSVAPRKWADSLRSFLTSLGWNRVGQDDNFYSYTSDGTRLYLTVYVDDILLAYDPDPASVAAADAFKSSLLSRFEGRDEGPVSRYLGISISRTDSSIKLSQQDLIVDLLIEHEMDSCNPVSTPMDPNVKLSAHDCPAVPDKTRSTKYRSIVGTALWLANWTRPDISYTVHILSKYVNNPGLSHWAAAKHLLRYLRGTASLALTYSRRPSSSPAANLLIGFADSDWASDLDTRKSVGAYVFFLNGAPISWKAKQQPCVASSTSEAEFMSASAASTEALWLRRLLHDFAVPQSGPTPLYEDNHACILMAMNPVHRERSKHIDLRVHLLRDRVSDGIIRLVKCPTSDMTADALTKALPLARHTQHMHTLLGLSPLTAPILSPSTKHTACSAATTLNLFSLFFFGPP